MTPQTFVNYLPVKVIINLIFVSTYTQTLILKKFKDIYYLSDGFTSDEQWFSILKKSANNLNEIIFNESYFDSTYFDYYFDYEKNFSGLLKQFRHLSLFSVSLHFLRCLRS